MFAWDAGLDDVGIRLRYDSMLAKRSPIRSIFFSLSNPLVREVSFEIINEHTILS
jgi:hypothetical protein